MPVQQKSPYQRHLAKWSNCERCELCNSRRHMVHLRGDIPADVFFIGEAPGKSENLSGIPFDGEAGILLDEIVKQSVPAKLTRAFANLVACLPLGEDGTKLAQPSARSIKECSPRLQELIDLIKPKLIICVGSLSYDWVPAIQRIPDTTVVSHTLHPAHILRAPTANRTIAKQQCRVKIETAIWDVFHITASE